MAPDGFQIALLAAAIGFGPGLGTVVPAVYETIEHERNRFVRGVMRVCLLFLLALPAFAGSVMFTQPHIYVLDHLDAAGWGFLIGAIFSIGAAIGWRFEQRRRSWALPPAPSPEDLPKIPRGRLH